MSGVAHWILAACTALAIAGCASPASRFYTLDAPAAPATGVPSSAAARALGIGVTVGPVAIPAVVDRPEMVLTVGPNEVWPDEFNRWAAPLADAIGLAIVGQLTVLLPSPYVTLLSQSPGDVADMRVAVEVQRFESLTGSHALLDAVFTVRSTATGRTQAGRTTAREVTADRSYDALAAAHSRAVARLSRDIEAAIAALATTPGTSPAR